MSLTLRQLLPGDESSPDQVCDSVQCLDRETAAAWIDEHATAVYCGWELTHPDGRTEHCYTGTGHPRVWIPGPRDGEPIEPGHPLEEGEGGFSNERQKGKP